MSLAYNIDGLPHVRAGAACRVITPPLNTGLAGYFSERVATWVRDSLRCNVLILEHEQQRLALVSCDLICFNTPLADQVKAAIQEAVGIPAANVLLHGTHTHTGPVLGNICQLPQDDDYIAALPQRIAETVRQAAASMFAAVLFAGRRDEDALGSNRLGRTRSGLEIFGKAGVIGPAGPVDPEVLSLGVRDMAGRMRALVVNYAMHPDVVGGGSADFFSADWPGELRRTLAQVYGEDTVTVFLNGTCGDLNHGRWDPTRLPSGRAAKSIQMGRALAGAAMAGVESAEPLEAAATAGTLEILDIPYYTRDQAFLDDVKALKQKPDDQLAGWERVVLVMNASWDKDGTIAHVPVQVMRFGDIMIVGLPGEVFTAWGLEIKHWSPAPYTFVVELANGWFGYVPTTDQAHRGAYGAKPILSRQLIADAGRQMADAIQRMMWTLWET